MADLKVGDFVSLKHGPWRSTWEVVQLVDAGARLNIVGDVFFEGFDHCLTAGNGDALTTTVNEAFIGRAHWPSTEVIQHGRPLPG